MNLKGKSSQKEKRKTNVKPPSSHAKNPAGSDPHVKNSNGAVEEENALNDLVLMGDEVGDPDISLLAQQEEELLEDDTIDLKNPEVAAELSEDPVRLYLREIGEVKLLDSDSEFRLATIIEANRFIGALRRRPLVKGLSRECAIYHSILTEMHTSWERLVEDAKRLNCDPPDLGLILTRSEEQ